MPGDVIKFDITNENDESKTVEFTLRNNYDGAEEDISISNAGIDWSSSQPNIKVSDYSILEIDDYKVRLINLWIKNNGSQTVNISGRYTSITIEHTNGRSESIEIVTD